MPRHIDWRDDWISENWQRFDSYQEMTSAYNDKFDECISQSAMKNHCIYKLGIKRENKRCPPFTDEEKEWLADNYPKLGRKEAHRQFNERFEHNRSERSIKWFASEYGLKVDDDVWRAHVAKNIKDVNYKPIGSEVVHNGRTLVKVADGEKWKLKNRMVYEQTYGDIPKGWAVIHLDNDPMNCSVNNLMAVPKQRLGAIIKAGMKSDNPMITKTAITWCELCEVLTEQGVALIEKHL